MCSLLVLLCAMFVLAGGPVLAQGGCASFVVDRELVIDFSGPSPVFQGPPELVALARFDTRVDQISQLRLTLELGDAGLHFVDGDGNRTENTTTTSPTAKKLTCACQKG